MIISTVLFPKLESLTLIRYKDGTETHTNVFKKSAVINDKIGREGIGLNEKRAFEEMPFMVPFAAPAENRMEPETHSAIEVSSAEVTNIPQNEECPEEAVFCDEAPFMTASTEEIERIAGAPAEDAAGFVSDRSGEKEAVPANECSDEMPFMTAAAAEKPEESKADAEKSIPSDETADTALKCTGKNDRKIRFPKDAHIQDLPLSPRSKNCLCRAGIITLEQLIAFDRDKLCEIRNLGAKSAVEIMEFLDDLTSEKQGNEETEEDAMEEEQNCEESRSFIKTNPWGLTNETVISDLKDYLSVRAINALMRNGIQTFGVLISTPEEQLLKTRNLGKKTLQEIQSFREKFSELIVKEACAGTVPDYLKNAFEKFENALALNDTSATERLRMCCYQSEAGESTEQELIEKWYRLPEVKNVVSEKVLHALRSHSVFGMCLADIRTLLPEDFPDELLEEILNEIAQKDHGKRYVPKSVSLDSLLENNPKITERGCDIFRMRLAGKTLEEAAQKYGVTRERVRQMQAKVVRIIKREAADSNTGITETRFQPLFAEYDFDEDSFCALTEQSLKAYRFLSIISDMRKRTPIEELFQEVQLPGWIRQNWEKYCRENTSFKYLCIAEDDNRLVEKSRQGILGYLLSKYCHDSILFDDFVVLYQNFLVKYGLENDPKLRITESEERSQENHLSGRPDVLWKQGRAFRYYPIQAPDYYAELLETLNLNQYHNVEISTLKLFRDYPDLMMQYDIRDEYELHNLLKKIECDKEIPDMRWGRNPHIYFGEFDKLAMIQEFMYRLAPIRAEDLADAISEAYGFKQNYIMSFFGCIDRYEKDGVYSIDHKAMSDAQLQLFAENLPEDFYYLEKIKSKFAQLFPDGDMELVNAFNLKRMGFVINSTYAVKNYRSASEYFHTLLTQNDITDITEMSKRFSGIMTFSSMLGNLKDNYTIIEFEPYHLIHIRKLEKMGVSVAQLKQYCDAVYAFTRNMTYFTIESLAESGFTSALDALGFEPWFYSSILREDRRFTYQKIGGSVLFDTACQEVSTQNLVLCILNQQNSIEIDQLLTGIQEKFHISLDRDRLIWRIQNTELYFDNIMQKVYLDYNTYYEELMSIDDEE